MLFFLSAFRKFTFHIPRLEIFGRAYRNVALSYCQLVSKALEKVLQKNERWSVTFGAHFYNQNYLSNIFQAFKSSNDDNKM